MDRPGSRHSKVSDNLGETNTGSSSKESFYEIDIQHADSKPGSAKNSSKLSGGTIAHITIEKEPGDRRRRRREKVEENGKYGLNVFANPFIESHYPMLTEIHSKEKKQLENKLNEAKKSEVKKFHESLVYNLLGKENNPSKTKEKENQTVPVKTGTGSKTNLNRMIIETFLSKKGSATANLLGNKVADDQLHLHHHEHHHHEHHHHYYFNSNKVTGPEDVMSVKRSNVDPRDSISTEGGRCSQERKHWTTDNIDKNMRDNPKATYFYECAENGRLFAQNKAYYSVSGSTYIKTSREEHERDHKNSKPCFMENDPAFYPAPRVKATGSFDSILNKRSDLIVTHNYSDSELSKYDSDDLTVTEKLSSRPDRFTVIKPKDYVKNIQAKNTNSDCSKIVQNLKKVESFLAPKILTESKKPSRVSYIRCQRAVPEMSSNSSGSAKKETEKIKETKEFILKDRTNEPPKVTESDVTPSTSQKEKGTLPSSAKRNHKQYEQENLTARNWAEKMKQELRDIKRELRKLEERHMRKRRKSLTIVACGNTVPEQVSGYAISVYSSKTFILGPENFHLSKTYQCSESSRREMESQFESNRFFLTEIEADQDVPSSSNYREKHKPEKRNIILGERCITSHQEVLLGAFLTHESGSIK